MYENWAYRYEYEINGPNPDFRYVLVRPDYDNNFLWPYWWPFPYAFYEESDWYGLVAKAPPIHSKFTHYMTSPDRSSLTCRRLYWDDIEPLGWDHPEQEHYKKAVIANPWRKQ